MVKKSVWVQQQHEMGWGVGQDEGGEGKVRGEGGRTR